MTGGDWKAATVYILFQTPPPSGTEFSVLGAQSSVLLPPGKTHHAVSGLCCSCRRQGENVDMDSSIGGVIYERRLVKQMTDAYDTLRPVLQGVMYVRCNRLTRDITASLGGKNPLASSAL
jgi:hypothetical protein